MRLQHALRKLEAVLVQGMRLTDEVLEGGWVERMVRVVMRAGCLSVYVLALTLLLQSAPPPVPLVEAVPPPLPLLQLVPGGAC